ncbi:MAG: ANTAR domain-containing protein [Eubacteriales bacterium]|nr:ANTAR domain-containing protein [Eubacteriales bacterium]
MTKDAKVLVISSANGGEEFFKKYLSGYFKIDFAFSGSEARRRVDEFDYDVVIVNCPLRDEFGTLLAEEISNNSYSGVIALIKTDVYESVAFALEKSGVYCIAKPVSPQNFVQGVGFAVTTNERLKGLIKNTESLKEKMEEIKLISRAKLLLITKLSFSEDEAHRYIEKRSMDDCIKKSAVAMDIIKTYG